MMKIFSKVLVSLLIGCNIFWLFAIPNMTQAAGGLGIMPKSTIDEPNRSWFVYTLRPGDAQEDVVVINNHSDKTMAVGIEAYDAQNTTDGAFTLVTDSKDNQDIGKWVTPSSDTITIPAGKSAEVNFRIEVPSGASVGEHSGAIAVYQKTNQSGGVGLKVIVGARIYVTVPGKIERNLTFDKVSHEFKDGKLVFHITTTNHSNINIQPSLDIRLRGLFRTYVQTKDDNGTYLPNKTITLTPTWSHGAPKLGYYRVNLAMNTWSVDQVSLDGTKTKLPNLTFRYSYGFWIGGPYFVVIALCLALAWVGFRLFAWWKDRRKFNTKVDTYIVQKGETMMHISEKTGALPELVVKLNRLSWPYSLNAGDKLMIPTRLLTRDELYRKQTTESLPSVWRYLISWKMSLYHPQISTSRLSVQLSRKRKR